MRASYLINELQQLIEKHGDLCIMYMDWDKGFHKYIEEVKVKNDEDGKIISLD